jgi:PadR family transcriptional regulator, regulatory protein AphA
MVGPVGKPLRLSLASYVLLGAIESAGPVTPYDLKRVVAQRVGPLFELAHSQYYDETARLAKAGLLEESQEDEGRRRLVYSITEEGGRALRRWLRVPELHRPELRDAGLLKLAFSECLDDDEVGNLARDQVQVARALRDELTEGAGALGPAGELNVAVVEAMIAFWAALAERLPDRAVFSA